MGQRPLYGDEGHVALAAVMHEPERDARHDGGEYADEDVGVREGVHLGVVASASSEQTGFKFKSDVYPIHNQTLKTGWCFQAGVKILHRPTSAAKSRNAAAGL